VFALHLPNVSSFVQYTQKDGIWNILDHMFEAFLIFLSKFGGLRRSFGGIGEPSETIYLVIFCYIVVTRNWFFKEYHVFKLLRAFFLTRVTLKPRSTDSETTLW
jgi:hypothetical protein